MGQQQLLLLVLAAIIVGAGVILGVNMFQENAAQANRDAVMQDVMTFAGKAQAFYRRPLAVGGGGQDFGNLTWAAIGITQNSDGTAATPTEYTNDNGTYTITPGATSNTCDILGEGKEDLDGNGNNLQVNAEITGSAVNVTYPES
jgi:hypothetical protein